MERRVFALAFALLAVMGAATAHAQFTPKRIWLLTVVVNVPGAVVLVDNQRLPNNQTRVTGGPHMVQVMADGYITFSGSVMVNGDQTLPVSLQPVPRAQPPLNVAPAPPAQQPPLNVAPAPPVQQPPLNVAPPPPAVFPLSIVVNVPTAAVFIDGVQARGVPLVRAGPHSVQVAADGYQDYTASINVMGPLTLNVVLKPVYYPSTLTFVIPQSYLDPDAHFDDPRSVVRIFVDGMLVNPHAEMERIPVLPGRHRIRVASGAFSVDIGDMEIRPRTNYVLELGMDVKVRSSRAGAY